MNRFGPINEPLVIDNFTFEDVNNGKCTASVCQNISDSLMSAVENRPQAKYLAICVPCYNENVMDLMKTFISLMQNVDFMQRTVISFHIQSTLLKHDFYRPNCTVTILVRS